MSKACDGELARVVALVNHMLAGNSACSFLMRYHDGFERIYKERQVYNAYFIGKAVTMVACTVFAPFVYARYVMDYPCEEVRVVLNGQESSFARNDCSAEDNLRSWYSLLIIPCVFICSGALVGAGYIVRMFAGKLGTKILFYLMRTESITASKLSKLFYHKYPQISAAVNRAYILFMIQMACVSAYQQSGIAAIVGYGCGEVLLLIANHVLAVSDPAIAVVDGKLATWTSDISGRGLFSRLKGITSDTCFVSRAEMTVLEHELSSGQWQKLLADVRADKYYIASPCADGMVEKHIDWGALQLRFVHVPEESKFIQVSSNPSCDFASE